MVILGENVVVLNKSLIKTTQIYISSKIKMENLRAAHAFKLARALLL